MRALSGKARWAVAAIALGVVLGPGAGEARGSPGWGWPVEGRVITAFANDAADPYAGGMHRGVDIAAPLGTPVRAARAGAITYAGALGYSGLTVAVRTVDGYVASYLHLGAISVRRGQALDAGARVGEVGTTGRRSKPEPHLHFGVRRADEPNGYVDPLSLLPPLRPPVSEGAPVPAPAPVAVPVRAQEAPAPAGAPVARTRRRAAAPQRFARPQGAVVPGPVPVGAPAMGRAWREGAARSQPVPHSAVRPVPVAPQSRPAQRAEPERPAPARAHEPAPVENARDWGRPLALAGVVLALLALLGRGALRALRDGNRALVGSAEAMVSRTARRPHLPRWRKAT